MSNRLSILLALAAALFVAGFSAEVATATPYFSLDGVSSSLSSGGTAGDVFRSPKALSLSHTALGLSASTEVDAISSGKDPLSDVDPCGPNVYYWSVDRATQGSQTGGSVNSAAPCFSMGRPVWLEAQQQDAAGDVFVQTWTPACFHPGCQLINQGRRVNTLWRDEQQLGLQGGGDDELDALELTTLRMLEGTAAQDVYFSVDRAASGRLSISAADVLHVAAGENKWETYWTYQQLGLRSADDIDGICVNESKGVVLFSLTPDSPSLAGVFSAADVFKVKPGVDEFPGTGIQIPWLPAQFLSLERTDNVDGLDCTLTRVKKKKPKYKVAGADCTPTLQFVKHGQQAVINVFALPGSVPILGSQVVWVGPNQPAGIVKNGNSYTVKTNLPPGPWELHILAINVFFGPKYGVQQVICGVAVEEDPPVATVDPGRPPEYPPVATPDTPPHPPRKP
jgi:hypothetical protein